jgi:hypothetical protein
MVLRTSEALPALYESDETAWLETMAELIRAGKTPELDFAHLQEYLSDMAKRDRREVQSRLATLIAHLLKWDFQPENRSRSWQGTIVVERRDLEDLLDSGVLKNHALAMLPKAYVKALKQAAVESGLPVEEFPGECPYTLEQVLTAELPSK